MPVSPQLMHMLRKAAADVTIRRTTERPSGSSNSSGNDGKGGGAPRSSASSSPGSAPLPAPPPPPPIEEPGFISKAVKTVDDSVANIFPHPVARGVIYGAVGTSAVAALASILVNRLRRR